MYSPVQVPSCPYDSVTHACKDLAQDLRWHTFQNGPASGLERISIHPQGVDTGVALAGFRTFGAMRPCAFKALLRVSLTSSLASETRRHKPLCTFQWLLWHALLQ